MAGLVESGEEAPMNLKFEIQNSKLKMRRKSHFNFELLFWVFPFSFLLFHAVSAAELSVTVVTLEGEEQPAKLLNISPDSFIFESGSVASKDITEIYFTRGESLKPAPAPVIHLRNGDVLRAAIVSGDDSKLKVNNEALGELVIENKFVDAIVFPETPAAARPPSLTPAAIENFLKSPPPQKDLLLLPKGDISLGFMEKFTDKELFFNAGGQSSVYPFERIAAFRLAPLEAYKAAADFRATILLRDVSKITGKLAQLKEDLLLFEGLDGQQWKVAIEAVQSIVFSGGKLVYLSDLTPQSVTEKSYVDGVPRVYPWRRNHSVTGAKLMVGGRIFERGLGVHSYCKIVYALDGQYAAFLCLAGMDASAPAFAVCSWKVNLDGKEAAAGKACASDQANAIKLSVKGAKELELICDYGPDDDDAGDHFDWANARLIR